jgi:ABC-type iron transport system FetAB permease component
MKFAMKFIYSFLLQAVLGYVITLFFPWWSVVVIAFVIGFSLKTKSWVAFLAGFAAMSALWAVYATFMDFQNGAILSEKVANLFQLPESNYLIYLTGLIGGLLGGMGSLTGQLFRNTLVKENKRYGSSRRKRFRHLKED